MKILFDKKYVTKIFFSHKYIWIILLCIIISHKYLVKCHPIESYIGQIIIVFHITQPFNTQKRSIVRYLQTTATKKKWIYFWIYKIYMMAKYCCSFIHFIIHENGYFCPRWCTKLWLVGSLGKLCFSYFMCVGSIPLY